MEDATRTAVKTIRDVQRTRDKAYADMARVGMQALPTDIRKGVDHLGEEAKKEILKNPVAASALLAVVKNGNPLLAGEIQALLKETCDPPGVISRLSTSPQKELDKRSKDFGGLTTPFKTEGVSGWINTGCRAEAVGVLTRNAERSTDDLWTVDVELKAFIVNGVGMPSGRHFIRIEVEPIGRAHDFCEHRNLKLLDVIQFGGPVLIDTDGPYLEVHPIDDLQLVVFA